MSKRSFHLLAFGGLAVALALAAQHSPAHPKKDAPKKEAPTAGIKVTPSKVTAVTVYPSGALVTREVEATGPAGRVELVISPLPTATVPSSVYAEGADGIRVLTTRFRSRPIMEDTRADVKKHAEELKQLTLAREKIAGELQAIQDNAKLNGKMEDYFNARPARDIEFLNVDAMITLSRHIREQRLFGAREIVDFKQQLQANQEQSELVKNRLNMLAAGIARYEQDAIIVVDKANDAVGTIKFNYLVQGASWTPQYKLRSDKADKDAVSLEYLAGVVQETGEDWPNVKLTLSTAQPALNSAPPDLQALHVSVAPKSVAPTAPAAQPSVAALEDQIKALRTKAQQDFNDRKDVSGTGLANTAAAREQSWELFNPEAAVKRGCMLGSREGPIVTYRIVTPHTISSRSDSQVLEVARIDLKPDTYYKTVPILSPHVYRMADLVNTSEHVLLPGEATMYAGSDFVGQMTLPLVAVGEKFTAGFGIDPQLVVQRSMMDKMRSTSGGNQLLRYDYRILVNSYKSEKVKLQVWDRLPHAESDAVGVQLLKAAPDLSKDALYLREHRPNNLLRWDVIAEPNAHGEKALSINFEFKLELDRQMTISGYMTAGDATSSLSPLPVISAADQVKIRSAMEKLSFDDRRLAEAQRYCAIDQDSPLGTMGPILKVNVKGQPVFVCCKGCEAEVKTHPDEALLKFQQLMKRVSGKP